jgi:hypothetical protein
VIIQSINFKVMMKRGFIPDFSNEALAELEKDSVLCSVKRWAIP